MRGRREEVREDELEGGERRKKLRDILVHYIISSCTRFREEEMR